jgi:hypothetical protein
LRLLLLLLLLPLPLSAGRPAATAAAAAGSGGGGVISEGEAGEDILGGGLDAWSEGAPLVCARTKKNGSRER